MWRMEPGWTKTFDTPGAGHMTIFKQIATSRPWWQRVPDQGLFASGVSSERTLNTAVRGVDSRWAMLYLASQCHVLVHLDKILTRSVKCTWVNPATGEEKEAGSFATGNNTGAVFPPRVEQWFSVPGSLGRCCADPGRHRRVKSRSFGVRKPADDTQALASSAWVRAGCHPPGKVFSQPEGFLDACPSIIKRMESRGILQRAWADMPNLLSLLVFFGATGLIFRSLEFALVVTASLGFHELGHAAMLAWYGLDWRHHLRDCGRWTWSPQPDRERLTQFANVMIHLSGPLFSFLLALLALGVQAAWQPQDRHLLILASFSAQVGFLNLLPLGPLTDGGKIVQRMMASLGRRSAKANGHPAGFGHRAYAGVLRAASRARITRPPKSAADSCSGCCWWVSGWQAAC